MNDSTDRDIRERFTQLRAAEAGDVPAFREMLGRASRTPPHGGQRGRQWLRPIAVPIALAAASILAVGVTRIARRRASMQVPLSTWTSPTASLLRTPGMGLSSPSGILTSVLDPVVSPSALREGTN